jgi:hypothetical protein
MADVLNGVTTEYFLEGLGRSLLMSNKRRAKYRNKISFSVSK